jgi:hypothetical protein
MQNHSECTRHTNFSMGAALSMRRKWLEASSFGVCVASKHGAVIMSDWRTQQLHVYSLIDGTAIRSIGSPGRGKGQFGLVWGGLCMSPDGDSVLVAERDNWRVQEVRIEDGSWVRFVGEGMPRLMKPQFVDCNADVIVVSQWCHPAGIIICSWADGSPRTRLNNTNYSPDGLNVPYGIRLAAGGSEFVVADCENHRLCVFTLTGTCVAAVGSAEQGLTRPFDALECASDGSFIVTNTYGHNLVKFSRDGVMVGVYGKRGSGAGQFCNPTALAALPNNGCMVVDSGNHRLQQLVDLRARLSWMRACVCRVMCT